MKIQTVLFTLAHRLMDWPTKTDGHEYNISLAEVKIPTADRDIGARILCQILDQKPVHTKLI